MSEKPLMPLLDYAQSRGMGSKAQAYTAAESGVIPVVRIGRLIFVPVAKADRALGLEPTNATESWRNT